GAQGGEPTMRIGMNMLLWTTDVGPEHYPLLAELKGMGYDGVEIPIFKRDDEDFRELRRALDDNGLACTAVTVVPPEANPPHPAPAVRRQAVKTLTDAARSASILGTGILCGPIHSPVGCRVGRGRTEEEWGWAVETLRAAAEAAADFDVTLVVEYLN